MDSENHHPNTHELDSPDSLWEGCKWSRPSPVNRLSTLSSRFSAYNMLDDSYFTATEMSTMQTPKQRLSEFGESDLRGLTSVLKLQDELLSLNSQLQARDEEIRDLRTSNENLQSQHCALRNTNEMMKAEVDCHQFMISLQQQKIGELENELSSTRIEFNEHMSARNKKVKSLTKKLEVDKIENEKRANLMVAQLNEQMSALQKMAFGRIEALEKELMSERHKVAALQSENKELQEENDQLIKELDEMSHGDDVTVDANSDDSSVIDLDA